MRPVIRRQSGFPTGTNSPSTCPEETPVKRLQTAFPLMAFIIVVMFPPGRYPGSPSMTLNVS